MLILLLTVLWKKTIIAFLTQQKQIIVSVFLLIYIQKSCRPKNTREHFSQAAFSYTNHQRTHIF